MLDGTMRKVSPPTLSLCRLFTAWLTGGNANINIISCGGKRVQWCTGNHGSNWPIILKGTSGSLITPVIVSCELKVGEKGVKKRNTLENPPRNFPRSTTTAIPSGLRWDRPGCAVCPGFSQRANVPLILKHFRFRSSSPQPAHPRMYVNIRSDTGQRVGSMLLSVIK